MRPPFSIRPQPAAFLFLALTLSTVPILSSRSEGQVDQGAITGTVIDANGAVVAHATVAITNLDTQFQLQGATDASGVYVFAPLKVGRYNVRASAPGFATAVREAIEVNVSERVGVNFTLRPGAVNETVVVTAAIPQLQTEEGSTGEVFSTSEVNDFPLNGRNWVYVAQLASGVSIPNGAQGAFGAAQMLNGSGDFTANGQRIWQNNFILDGVDNNSNLQDFLNGATYVMRPPPDALAEFKVETSDYSAELGHSAGAVINAAVKSGTNSFRGSLWEYWRNNALDATDHQFAAGEFQTPYHQNQFGATFGGPILKDKLFFFADTEATRILFYEPPSTNNTVPTLQMRTSGYTDFTQMLNPALTTGLGAIPLFARGGQALSAPVASGGQPVGPAANYYLSCNGIANTICPNQVDRVAARILNLFPEPNAGVPGQVFNNYTIPPLRTTDNSVHHDLRLDWNARTADQFFIRYSYGNRPQFFTPPFGSPLDGGGFGTSGTDGNRNQNLVFSETHVFTPTLVNEFRFGYNWIRASFLQVNSNLNEAAQLGLGGIPFYPENGGMPDISFGGYINGIGSPQYMPSDERDNTFEFLDNVTRVLHNHSLKFGVEFMHLRFFGLQPPNSLGSESFSGAYTSDAFLGAQGAITGSGVADFVLNDMNSSGLTGFSQFTDRHWYEAAYFQDDWKVNSQLTLNLGLRYEYPQPNAERDGHQANFIGDYRNNNQGSGTYLIPASAAGYPMPTSLVQAFAKDHITVQYVSNPYLVEPDKRDFAPRFGFAYRPTQKTVIRGGFGIFYGGLENVGLGPNLGSNEPFNVSAGFSPNPNLCENVMGTVTCPTNGQTLETGFGPVAASPAALARLSNLSTIFAASSHDQTPYSEAYNLTVEQALTRKTSFRIGYVGNVDRHLESSFNANTYAGIRPAGSNGQLLRPFFDFGTIEPILNQGKSAYNSLQATVEHRQSSGLSFLGNYTWSHCLDDAFATIGQARYGGYRNPNFLGFGYDYGACVTDVRGRFTFDGTYELPLGRGKRFLDQKGVLNQVLGGWKTTLVFVAQSGLPVFLSSSNQGESYPLEIGDPFAPGGTPLTDGSQTGFVCAAQTRTLKSWYNPCAFRNPPIAVADSTSGCPGSIGKNQVCLSRAGLLPFGPRGRVSVEGPGYNKLDLALFKNFPIPFHESQLQFRTDIFNLLNHPSYAIPNSGLTGSSASAITNTLFSGETPDARVIQLALRYSF